MWCSQLSFLLSFSYWFCFCSFSFLHSVTHQCTWQEVISFIVSIHIFFPLLSAASVWWRQFKDDSFLMLLRRRHRLKSVLEIWRSQKTRILLLLKLVFFVCICLIQPQHSVWDFMIQEILWVSGRRGRRNKCVSRRCSHNEKIWGVAGLFVMHLMYETHPESQGKETLWF